MDGEALVVKNTAWSEFAQKVNRARIDQRLSISSIARIASVPKATAQGWLSGRQLPTPALRRQYLLIVESLGLTAEMPGGLWLEDWDQIESRLRTAGAPYLGLRQFEAADVEVFFGRAQEAQRLAEMIISRREESDHGVIAVIGPSGSGKSSLLTAGLSGRECATGKLAGWRLKFVDLLSPTEPAGEADLVVVDQLEDALALPDVQRAAALTRLMRYAGEGLVLVALRSDAFAEAEGVAELAQGLGKPFLLSPLTREDLRSVIVAPAAVAGASVDEELVEVLLNELAPGSVRSRVHPETLPLLSNALLVTWAAGDGTRLTLANYRKVGGVAGAVELLAEQVYQQLDPEGQLSVKRLFLRLVGVSNHARIRLAVPVSEIAATVQPVLDAFLNARLLTISGDQVRISHEVLVRHWQRLGDWVEGHAAELAARSALQRAAQQWRNTDDDPAALIPVQRLASITVLATDPGKRALLSGLEREFLAASEQHFASALEQERQTSQRLRRQRIAALSLALASSVLAVGAGIFFFRGEGLRAEAVQARSEAQSRQAAISARTLSAKSPNLAAQLGLVANGLADTTDGRSVVVAATGLELPMRRLGDPEAVLATSSDGGLVARATSMGKVTLWRGEEIITSPGTTLALDPKGGRLLTVALAKVGDRLVLAVGGANLRQLWDITADPVLVADLGASAATTAITFSPSGGLVAAGDETGVVSLYRVDAGGKAQQQGQVRLEPTAGVPTKVTSVALSGAGRLYVGGRSGSIDVWQLDGSQPQGLPAVPTTVAGPAGEQAVIALTLAIRPDGKQLAAGVSGNEVKRWYIAEATPTPEPSLTGIGGWVNAVAFGADGTRLAVASSDRSISVFDVVSGVRVRHLVSPAAQTGAGFAAGGRLIGAGADGTLSVWPAQGPTLRSSGSAAGHLATDSAKWLAAGTASDGISLWKQGASLNQMPKPAPPALPEGDVQDGAVGIAPNGAFLLGSTLKGQVLSWPLTGGGAGAGAAYDTGMQAPVTYTAISPDSSLVAAMSAQAGMIVLFNADSRGALTKLAEIAVSKPQQVEFSSDGKVLVIAQGDNSVALWSVGAEPHLLGAAKLDSLPTTLDLAPSSYRVAVGQADGEVSLWEFSDPAHLTKLRSWHDPAAEVYSLEFSPDERWLLGTSGDDLIWGWDLTKSDAEAQLAFNGDLGHPLDMRYLDGGKRFAVSGSDGTVRVWEARVALATANLCTRIGDQLTAEEWRQLVPGVEPREVC